MTKRKSSSKEPTALNVVSKRITNLKRVNYIAPTDDPGSRLVRVGKASDQIKRIFTLIVMINDEIEVLRDEVSELNDQVCISFDRLSDTLHKIDHIRHDSTFVDLDKRLRQKKAALVQKRDELAIVKSCLSWELQALCPEHTYRRVGVYAGWVIGYQKQLSLRDILLHNVPPITGGNTDEQSRDLIEQIDEMLHGGTDDFDQTAVPS